jgi:hypothetical protein
MPIVANFSAATSIARATVALQIVSASSQDGDMICNTSGAFSQVPGRADYFVGRGFGVGTLDYCHNGLHNPSAFLALFKMDWERHILVLEHYLLQPPLVLRTGVELHSSYDPYVAVYNDEFWVTFECTSPRAVSTCVAPLSADLAHLDLSRLTVAVMGTLGPHGANKQIVGLVSASAPTLLTMRGELFLYWQVDYFDNQLPQNAMVTRGMKLRMDARGRLWGVGADGNSVRTDDPKLTTVVSDVDLEDTTSNHVSLTTDVRVFDNRILEIASIGGTEGAQICRSTHDVSLGCWRVSLSIATSPLGRHVFGKDLIKSSSLPANGIEYPRIIVDPHGDYHLFGNFFSPRDPRTASMIPERFGCDKTGLGYIPIDPEELLKQAVTDKLP